MLHLRELELPFRRKLGREELGHAEAVQERYQGECLCGRRELAPVAKDILLVDQALDDLGACRGRAKPFFAHRFAQFVVLDRLARTLHCREQRGFVETRGWLGLVGDDADLLGPCPRS